MKQYKPYFVNKNYPVPHPKRVIFFFTGYGTKVWFYGHTYKILNAMGYSVFSYGFPGRELTKIDGSYLDELRIIIQNDVRTKIEACKQDGIEEFASFGVSMGSVYSIGVVKAFPEIKRMVMITAYGNCARQVWEQSKLKKSKNYYLKKEQTMEDVYKQFPRIEPTIDIEKLKGKDMLLFCSSDDKIIYIENTYEFINKAHEEDLNLKVIVGKGNHVPFCFKTLKSNMKWREFLR
jgi:esterase/lipase